MFQKSKSSVATRSRRASPAWRHRQMELVEKSAEQVCTAPRVSTLSSLVSKSTLQACANGKALVDGVASHISKLESNQGNGKNRQEKHIFFVSPSLPHPCEMEIWNETVRLLGVKGTILTAKSEEKSFKHFVDICSAMRTPLHLEYKLLETIQENKTFLAGLEQELENASLVIAVGEVSLASFQALKARRSHQHRLAIWQNAPRPPEYLLSRAQNQNPATLSRERTVRREVLKSCDALISFDKDSSTWAYLEDVNAQRIRRVSRGVSLNRFSKELTASRRIEMRARLGLPETDFIFLQAGPLEIDSGAMDSVYAFKSLLQSNPGLSGHTKLVFCGTGSAGGDVRQTVVNLRLDDHVYFLNPNDENTLQVLGNQLSNLLAICDAVIHNPVAPVNGSPQRYLDCTYDVLCSLASGLTVISNGNGWVGEWIARFYRTFSSGSLHSQVKLMRESIEKQERLVSIKRAVRMAIENELSLEKSADELAKVLRSLMSSNISFEEGSVARVFEQIEKMVSSRQYVEAIQLISDTFKMAGLSETQKAMLFRNIADCFTKLGDLENGLQNYIRSLEHDPYCAKTFVGLGTVALQAHNYNVAVPQFQKAVALAPKDDMASLGLGLAFEGLGENKEALNWTLRACNLNIENTVAIYNLVKLAYDLDQYVEAEDILTRYVALHPNDVNMTFTLGGIAFKLGKVEEAVRQMENILVLDPMNSRAHSLLGQINREQRRQVS